MVAADVHGKNHFKNGSFSNYVEFLDLMNAKGEIIRCSRKENRELFNWTLGGMGLTGIILKVGFYLKKVRTSWIKQKLLISKNIDDTLNIFEENLKSSYSVAWIDCHARGKKLGRSLIMFGEHAEISDLDFELRSNPLEMKSKQKILSTLYFPRFLLNHFTVKL